MKFKLFLMMMLAIVQLASAQMTEWTWDTYQTKFMAPKDFKVLKNDKTIFSAGNEHINLTIYPREDSELEYEEMLELLENWAISTKLTYETGGEYIEDLNGYWGCFIDGIAENDNPTTVMLIADPDFPDIHFYIWMQYQDGYFDTAVEILKSISPN